MGYRFETISDIIRRYKKDEIMIALDVMDVDYKKSWRKGELMEKLEEALRTYVTEIFYMLSQRELGILKSMTEHEGNYILNPEAEEEAEVLDSLGILANFCLIDPEVSFDEEGRHKASASREFLELFTPYLEPVRLSQAAYLDEAARLIAGCLYYYGALPVDDLYSIVSRNHGNMDRKMFERVLSYKEALADLYIPLYDKDVEYIVDPDFSQFHTLKDVAAWGKGVSYKPFTRTELLDAGHPLFLEEPEGYGEIYDALEPHLAVDAELTQAFPEISREFVLGMLLDRTIALWRMLGPYEEIITELWTNLEFDSLKESKELAQRMKSYLQSLSRWDLKGYSLEEHKARKMRMGNNVIPLKAYVNRRKN